MPRNPMLPGTSSIAAGIRRPAPADRAGGDVRENLPSERADQTLSRPPSHAVPYRAPTPVIAAQIQPSGAPP